MSIVSLSMRLPQIHSRVDLYRGLPRYYEVLSPCLPPSLFVLILRFFYANAFVSVCKHSGAIDRMRHSLVSPLFVF